MSKFLCALFVLMIFFSPITHAAERAVVLNVNGAISPATQDYVERGIAYAVSSHAVAVIIQLDTPGGLATSMRGIDAAIIKSPIPIITYVAPAGARAASAGTFIVYASHLNAMAPGTNIGAASPVNLLGSQTNPARTATTEDKKNMNDASASIRSLAQLRGRNADWADSAVTKATSISAEEAKKLNVIDTVANDYTQLLTQLDGHTVSVNGTAQKVSTKNLTLEQMPQDWRYQFLAFITNPNIAYIFLLIAIYGLFFELSNPGAVLPGVAGAISLLLVLYAFQLMPINYAGLALTLLGICFMLFEVYVSSFGVIGIGGLIAFVIGSVMLFDVHDANYQLSWSLILTMSAISAAFFIAVIMLAVRSHRKAVVTGSEGMIGSEGVVLSVSNKGVTVRVLGEIWEAQTAVMLKPGQKIKVTKIKGLELTVKPVD